MSTQDTNGTSDYAAGDVYVIKGDRGKPRFRFRFLSLTTMLDAEIIDWFTTAFFRLATQSTVYFGGHLGISNEVALKFSRSFFLNFVQLLCLITW